MGTACVTARGNSRSSSVEKIEPHAAGVADSTAFSPQRTSVVPSALHQSTYSRVDEATDGRQVAIAIANFNDLFRSGEGEGSSSERAQGRRSHQVEAVSIELVAVAVATRAVSGAQGVGSTFQHHALGGRDSDSSHRIRERILQMQDDCLTVLQHRAKQNVLRTTFKPRR